MTRLPDFIVIGAMKSGTTTLHTYLDSHPSIFMSNPKEPRFFSLDDRYALGMDWYASLFADAQPDQIVGEASTCYSRWPFHPDVIDRISQHLPATKFVYLMRDPAKRVYSHYRHRMEERLNANLDVLPFSKAVEEDAEIVETGLYARQLKRYFDRFDRNQFCFLIFEEFVADPTPHLNRLFEFLDVPPLDPASSTTVKSNESGTARADVQIQSALGNFRRMPLFKSLIDILPVDARRGMRRSISKAVANSPFGRAMKRRTQAKIPPYDPADRERMQKFYVEPNRELEALLGQRLSMWSS